MTAFISRLRENGLMDIRIPVFLKGKDRRVIIEGDVIRAADLDTAPDDKILPARGGRCLVRLLSRPDLEEVAGQIAAVFGIESNALLHGGKRAEFSAARGAFCYIATRKLGFPGAEIAKMLNISRGGVALAADRGEAICKTTHSLQNLFRST